MKSRDMFAALVDRLSDVAYSAGRLEMSKEQRIDDLSDELSVAYADGRASRDGEVSELTNEISRLVCDVRELVDQVGALESQLRDKQLDSYNAGVRTGRENEVTAAMVKIMTDIAARTIFGYTG